MAPPAKRRRRTGIVESSSSSESSNDEAAPRKKPTASATQSSSAPIKGGPITPKKIQSTLNITPTKVQPKSNTVNRPKPAAPIRLPTRDLKKKGGVKSASTSPEKAKNGKGSQAEKGKSRDLYTFFSAKAQSQRAPSAGPTTAQDVPSGQSHKDDISDDDEIVDVKALPSSVVGAAAKKRAKGSGPGDIGVVSGSQKFMRPPAFKPEIRADDDLRPWAERFAPINLDELAVHKRKVSDVRGWLESVMSGRLRQRVLILKGAAGTGKTTTINLLAKDLGCEILEWRNPSGTVASSDGFVSMAAQFEEFIGRGGKFGQLDMFSDEVEALPDRDVKPLDRRKSIILVEEFPNTFTRSSTALQSFRSAILQYLASNTPSPSMMFSKQTNDEPVIPLIMVISETLLTTSTASADSFTAHRLLGPEILQHPGVTAMEFNAIAPTLLAKALDLVVVKEARKSGRRKTPGPLVLKRLGEVGDVRSAIGSLEFLCLRGDDNGDWSAKVAFTKGKKVSKDTPMTKMETQSLELVTRREASLGIFHAVGRVVHNKRDELARTDDVEKLLEWQSQNARPKRSEVCVDELIDETGTDTQTFVAALHENYLLSCDASPLSYDFTDLDHVNGCIDALSDSDLLCPSWDGSFNSTGFGGGTGGRGSGGDISRQDELCFQLAVRGILFALPCPVKRRAPAQGTTGIRISKGGDAFKMFYPTSLKLWREKEEIESTIDLWVAKLTNGEDQIATGTISSAAAFAKPKPGSVETWRSQNTTQSTSFSSSSTQGPVQKENETNSDPEEASPLLGTGTSARKEMLLERLPYMVMIGKAKRRGPSSMLRGMERVTQFTGIGRPSDEDEEDEQPRAVGENWATDKPAEDGEPKSRGVKRGKKMAVGTLGLEQRFAEQKLVLSDDDIEDD